MKLYPLKTHCYYSAMPVFRIKHVHATTLWTPLMKAGHPLAVLKTTVANLSLM